MYSKKHQVRRPIMRSTAYHLSISTARADALFVSALQRSDEPGTTQIRQAIAATIRVYGTQGCAARVAQEYGEHPETAVLRMRWVRALVEGHGEVTAAGVAERPGRRALASVGCAA
jgi:hypothetical protein